MNRFLIRIAAAVFASILISSQLQAQITTTYAKNATPGQQNGFYYSLPLTMLQLDFVLEETQCEPGQLSSYASTYFGSEEAIEYSTTEYKLLDVKMKPIATPDPNATFFVSYGATRGGGKVAFDVLPNGIIRSIGSGITQEAESAAQAPIIAPVPTEKCSNCAKNHGFLSLMTSGKSDAQLAREAADKIAEIRDSKFKLVSGYYETAFVPEHFRDMYAKLEEMEQDYMSLFLGRRVTKTVVKTVYVIPSKDVVTQTVAKFSEDEGLTTGTSGSGSLIMVQTLPLNTTTAINAPSQTAVETLSYDNKLFYRVPETANVKVSCNNVTLLEERLIVNQLGVLLMAPFANTQLEFDVNTGQIVNMRMQ
jgi:hypothetical protein